MLALSRKIGEQITIDDHIRIHVVQVKGNKVRIGIDAPKHISVHRKEVYDEIENWSLSGATPVTESGLFSSPPPAST